MSNKSSNGSSTGMISADDLTEKDPNRYEGCVDAFILRDLDRIQRLLSRLARQNVRKRQLTFLKKLQSFGNDYRKDNHNGILTSRLLASVL